MVAHESGPARHTAKTRIIGRLLPRVYPIVDTGVLERRGWASDAFARALLDGGARLLQVRHKGFVRREDFAIFEKIRALCQRYGATMVLNDRADLAALLDAGLHVGQQDLPPTLARRLVSTALLGFSTHNAAQLASANHEPADYLAVGPVFATSSKPGAGPPLGVDALPALRALTVKPLVAIGGITLETAPLVLEHGADSVAVIGALIPDTLTSQSLTQRMHEWLKATS
jgi:thiamine-phosphate pyrophosphorylase